MKSLTKFLLIIFIINISLTPLLNVSAQAPAISKNNINVESQYEPEEVIVKFKQKISASKREQIEEQVGIEELKETIGPRKNKNIQLFELEKGVSVKEAIKDLNKQKLVEYAEPNYIGHVAAVDINDSFFGYQWGLNNIGQEINGETGTPDADIDMPEAWEYIGGLSKTPVIAVIDSGIDLTHPDLVQNIWQNNKEIPDDGLDNDNNGYKDDFNGFNWAAISQRIYYGMVDDVLTYFYYDFGKDNLPDQTNSIIAQSFKGNGGYINKIALSLRKIGAPGNIKVSLREELDGQDLASVEINQSDPLLTSWTSNDNWIEKDFADPVKVTKDNEYFLVLSTNNNDSSNYYEIGSNEYEGNGNVDRFPDGKAYINNGSWADMNKDDIAFKLYFDSKKGGSGGGIPRDNLGHGTHVSGIASAATNNSKGIAGIAGYPENASKIMPLRAVDSQGFGYDSDWADAIYYAADNGADVINISLGQNNYSITLREAVDYAYNKGVVVVAAAGNEAKKGNPPQYPASYNNVISVGSTTSKDEIASTSTYNSYVDLSAPGENIYSTTPQYPYYSKNDSATLNYDFKNGTSMASPAVAALAALIKAKWPEYLPAQIKQLMEQTSDDLGAVGRDDYFGHGRINAGNVFTKFDNTAPVITNVTSNKADGNYRAGALVDIRVSFSEKINIDTSGGMPFITLETGGIDRNATYWYKSNSTTLVFKYTVQLGDNALDLDYMNNSSLYLNGSSIKDEALNNANLIFTDSGKIGSLSMNKNIFIDTTSPTIPKGLLSYKNGNYVKKVINLKTKATDNTGVEKVSYFIDSTKNPIGTSFSKPFSIKLNTAKKSNGMHLIITYVYDKAGNYSTKVTKLRFDNSKPRTFAPVKARFKKDEQISLFWKVTDKYTSNKAHVTIEIKKGKKTIRKLKLGWQQINWVRMFRFKADLNKGKYEFFIFAKDRAGNKQFNIAKNDLVIID